MCARENRLRLFRRTRNQINTGTYTRTIIIDDESKTINEEIVNIRKTLATLLADYANCLAIFHADCQLINIFHGSFYRDVNV